MPLDGHAYLVSQGWTGKGSGLRHGAIAKPITVVQKKTLSGIGKDRDDAFPFWDHVFSAAADKIKLKIQTSDDSDDTGDSSPPPAEFKRTSTGIISHKRPPAGTPAISGSATPTVEASSSSGVSTPRPGASLMAAAKQEAAKRMLYSMFFRGPVMRSEYEETTVVREETTVAEQTTVTERTTLKKVVAEESFEVDAGSSAKPHREKKKSKKDKEIDRGDSITAVEVTDEGKSKKKSKKSEDDDAHKKSIKKRKRNHDEEIEEDSKMVKKEKKRRKAAGESKEDVAAVHVEDKKWRRRREKEEKRTRKAARRARRLPKVANAAAINAATDKSVAMKFIAALQAADTQATDVVEPQKDYDDSAQARRRKKRKKESGAERTT